jgi:hypothetical protein
MTPKMKSIFIACGIVIISLIVVAYGTVQAQSVVDRKNDYQRDLDIYRDSYAQFIVKKSEYEQFKTFAAEEELVTISKQVLLARSDVWIAYWQLLSQKLDVISSDSTIRKPELQAQLRSQIDWLIQHKANISASKTRSSLLSNSHVLNDKKDDWGAIIFDVNSEISASMVIQSAKDLSAFNAGLIDRVNQQQFTPQEKEIKLRGLAGNIEQVTSILTRLEKLREYFMNTTGYGDETAFVKISQELNPLYTELNQQYQVASELSLGVEW